MTQEEILQYNKRCADFLGISNGYFKSEIDCPTPEYQWMCTHANCTYEIQKEDFPLLSVWDYLKFHSDWNWIMEVVEAIEKLGYDVVIAKTSCSIKMNKQLVKAALMLETKKEAVVEAINQFLIWYNKNKQYDTN